MGKQQDKKPTLLNQWEVEATKLEDLVSDRCLQRDIHFSFEMGHLVAADPPFAGESVSGFDKYAFTLKGGSGKPTRSFYFFSDGWWSDQNPPYYLSKEHIVPSGLFRFDEKKYEDKDLDEVAGKYPGATRQIVEDEIRDKQPDSDIYAWFSQDIPFNKPLLRIVVATDSSIQRLELYDQIKKRWVGYIPRLHTFGGPPDIIPN